MKSLLQDLKPGDSPLVSSFLKSLELVPALLKIIDLYKLFLVSIKIEFCLQLKAKLPN